MIELVAGLLFLITPAEIAKEAQGRTGIAAVILEGNRPIFSLKPGERFPMQSVYKLPIAMAALAEVDRGKLKLDQTVRVDKSEYVSRGQYSPMRDAHPEGTQTTVKELLELAVGESDGTASDVLLRLMGGTEPVMKFLEQIGVREMMVRDPEMALGHDWSLQYRNWATPAGALEVLRALQESRGLSPSSRALLLAIMTDSKRLSSRIKGLLPPGTAVAHKPGSSGSRNGTTAATNDIGIITLPDGRHLAIAVFVSDSKADTETRDRVIAKIARQAWDVAVKNP